MNSLVCGQPSPQLHRRHCIHQRNHRIDDQEFQACKTLVVVQHSRQVAAKYHRRYRLCPYPDHQRQSESHGLIPRADPRPQLQKNCRAIQQHKEHYADDEKYHPPRQQILTRRLLFRDALPLQSKWGISFQPEQFHGYSFQSGTQPAPFSSIPCSPLFIPGPLPAPKSFHLRTLTCIQNNSQPERKIPVEIICSFRSNIPPKRKANQAASWFATPLPKLFSVLLPLCTLCYFSLSPISPQPPFRAIFRFGT